MFYVKENIHLSDNSVSPVQTSFTSVVKISAAQSRLTIQKAFASRDDIFTNGAKLVMPLKGCHTWNKLTAGDRNFCELR